MLLVKTKIGQSNISGIGLFADQFIPKGTPIWIFMPGFDQKVSKKKLNILSEPSKKQFLNYAYLNHKSSLYILSFDDTRFTNHSDNPNCITADQESISVAGEDIEKGDELTENYRIYDADFDYKMSIN
jgi:hypothetical protein